VPESVPRSGKRRAKTDRAQLRKVIDQLETGDVFVVTRLDRLTRSMRDFLNTLAAIAGKRAGGVAKTWRSLQSRVSPSCRSTAPPWESLPTLASAGTA
jgi:hypothetical protein